MLVEISEELNFFPKFRKIANLAKFSSKLRLWSKFLENFDFFGNFKKIRFRQIFEEISILLKIFEKFRSFSSKILKNFDFSKISKFCRFWL